MPRRSRSASNFIVARVAGLACMLGALAACASSTDGLDPEPNPPGGAQLVSVSLAPDDIALVTGASVSFSALGHMSDNSTRAVSVIWTATGGTITSDGQYVAGSAAGSFHVIATESSGEADTGAVTLSEAAPVGNGLALTAAAGERERGDA